MKRVILSLFAIMCFVGCYEVNEEITINQDGTGTHNTKMDMGQMLEMIQSMAGGRRTRKRRLRQGSGHNDLHEKHTRFCKGHYSSTERAFERRKAQSADEYERKAFQSAG